MQASWRRIIKSKNLKRERSTGQPYLGLCSLSASLCVSVSLSLPRPLSHSVSILPPLWQTAPPAFFMFGCCRRGINLLFVAVNQISTDRFKLIASVSWSPKKRVLQAPISFYSPSDILINDTRTHTHMHTQTQTHIDTHTWTEFVLFSPLSFFRFQVLLAHPQRTFNQRLQSLWWH